MSTDLRFGLIGCGRIGSTGDDRMRSWPIAQSWLPYSHASAIVEAARCTLVAVCDPDEVAARAASKLHGASGCYTDVQSMLDREKLDAVAIATRTPERFGILLQCAEAGVRGVYCEKPLTNTLEDADQVAAAFDARGIHFVYGTKRRYMPLYLRARELVRDGCIGKLETIVVRFGVAPLLWAHPHSVDMISFFANDDVVEHVQADLVLERSAAAVIDGDPIVRMANFVFKSGVNGQIVAAASQDIDLCGTTATLSIRSDGHQLAWRRAIDPADGWFMLEEVEPARAAKSGTTLSIEALASAILDGSRLDGIHAAVRNQEMLFALVESELTGGAKVRCPPPRRGLRITGRSGSRFA